MDLMVKGPFLAMKFAWPQLTRQPGGRIIVTSCTAGLIGAPDKAAYASGERCGHYQDPHAAGLLAGPGAG